MTAWAIGVAMLMAGGQDGGAAMRGMAEPAAACPATPAPLPAAYAGWNAATPVVAATDAAGAGVLSLGTGARVTLASSDAVHWATPPGHAPAPASRGGLVALSVPAAGRYRLALGAGAWIDLVRDGAAVRSVAHAHGPACTPVRKTVDFDLTPGRYLIQLSGTAAATVDLMALRVAG